MEKSRIPALQRTIQILDLLAERGKCQSSEIIACLGIPKSSAYLLFDELKRYGLITQDKNGFFSLWMKLIALGEQAELQLDLREVARKHLVRLMEDTGLLCHLGIMDGSAAYYILKIESQSTISVRSCVGKMLSLYSSGIGKCLLAWQPAQKRCAIIRIISFVPSTPATITNATELEAALAVIRERGWSFDNGEDIPDVRCIGAPIFDVKGDIVAAISVVGAFIQIEDGRVQELSGQVMSCAEKISKDLGWAPA